MAVGAFTSNEAACAICDSTTALLADGRRKLDIGWVCIACWLIALRPFTRFIETLS